MESMVAIREGFYNSRVATMPPNNQIRGSEGRCSGCEEWKPLSEFGKSKSTKNPWLRCRSCGRAAVCGEPVSRECDGGCGKILTVTTRRAAERGGVYCERQCKDNAAFRKRYREDPEFRKSEAARGRAKYHRNPDLYRATGAKHAAKRRAMQRGATVTPFTREYIIERDGSRCHLCGKKCKPGEIHLDHLVPLALGGDHSAENVKVAHAHCNQSKRTAARNEQLLLIG